MEEIDIEKLGERVDTWHGNLPFTTDFDAELAVRDLAKKANEIIRHINESERT